MAISLARTINCVWDRQFVLTVHYYCKLIKYYVILGMQMTPFQTWMGKTCKEVAFVLSWHETQETVAVKEEVALDEEAVMEDAAILLGQKLTIGSLLKIFPVGHHGR